MSDALDQRLLEALLDSWDRNNTVLLNLLRTLPEGELEARAMEGSHSIAELFTHIHNAERVMVEDVLPRSLEMRRAEPPIHAPAPVAGAVLAEEVFQSGPQIRREWEDRRSINSAAHGSSCEPLNLPSTSAPRSVQSRQERHRLGIVSLSPPLPRNLPTTNRVANAAPRTGILRAKASPTTRSRCSGSSFQDHIERGFGRAAESCEAAFHNHIAQPRLARLSAERQPDLLGQRGWRADKCRSAVEDSPDRVQVLFDPVVRHRLDDHPRPVGV